MKKYMEELVKVNEDADFLNFISVEKDNMMIENSIRDEAKRKGLKEGLEQGIEQGIEKGLEQGIEQGSEKEKINIARNMLKENMNISLISKLTGLTEEKINNLK